MVLLMKTKEGAWPAHYYVQWKWNELDKHKLKWHNTSEYNFMVDFCT